MEGMPLFLLEKLLNDKQLRGKSSVADYHAIKYNMFKVLFVSSFSALLNALNQCGTSNEITSDWRRNKVVMIPK